MKKSIVYIGVVGILLSYISVASAQTATPRINKRERNQERRIRQGERSGQLTPVEAGRLQAQENQIRQQKRADKADGVVTPQERRTLRREENQTSRAIYRKKHNNRAW